MANENAKYSAIIWDSSRQQWVKIGSSNMADVLYGTCEEWDTQRTLRSAKNTIYVYTDYGVTSDDPPRYIPGIKMGDGNAYLIDLPFINGDYETLERHLEEHVSNTSIHVTAEEKTYWNSKSRVVVEGGTMRETPL